LDMNDVKRMNTEHGDAGVDEAFRRFFTAIHSAVTGSEGDAYRKGGDEVVMILPAHSPERAESLVQLIFKDLDQDPARITNREEKLVDEVLTASVGVAWTTSYLTNPQQ